MPKEKENWQKHPDFYMSDGTIVLLAESTLFRVYARLLIRHSSAFQELIEPSQSRGNVLDVYDGCPLVRLPDNPKDIVYFLKVTMGLWRVGWDFSLDPPMSYSMASSILRFSSKYMAQSVRRQVIERFKHIIPQSFDEVGNTKSYAQVFGSDEPQPHLFQLLSLFRECKLMTFLPWTYYAICALGFEKLIQGDITHDEKEIRLDTYDTRIALLGWKTLCQMTHNIRTQAITLPQCCTSTSSYFSSCSQSMRLAWTRKATSTFETEVMERWELFKALAYSGKPSHESLYDGYKFTLDRGRPCRDCATEWLRQEKKARVNIWSQLPRVFELPDWETLKRDEELGLGSDSNAPSEGLSTAVNTP